MLPGLLPSFVRQFFRLLTENAELRAEVAALKEDIGKLQRAGPASRPAKGRSPPVWRFRVVRWEWIETQMQGRLDPVPKMVPTLRVYVPLEDQPDGPGYWDITRKRAYTMLEPVLQWAQETGAYVELRQMGKGFRSFDALSFYPINR